MRLINLLYSILFLTISVTVNQRIMQVAAAHLASHDGLAVLSIPSAKTNCIFCKVDYKIIYKDSRLNLNYIACNYKLLLEIAIYIPG